MNLNMSAARNLLPTLTKVEPFLHLPSNSKLLTLTEPQSTEPCPAVFLDRDGVIVAEVGYVSNFRQIHILEGVAKAIIRLQREYFTVIITNQSGISRGILSESDLFIIHELLIQKLSAEGAVVDAIYFCPHHPKGIVPKFMLKCQCRKPESGMLSRASSDWNLDLSRSFIVGDMNSDIEAGSNVGVPGFLVDPNNAGSDSLRTVSGLPEAVDLIIKTQTESDFRKQESK